MPPKTIPSVTVLYLDFDGLAQGNDQSVINHMSFALRSSKKKLFAKSVKYDRCRVNRQPNVITIHLFNDKTETARFAFTRTQI
jgi:hypothetical protein